VYYNINIVYFSHPTITYRIIFIYIYIYVQAYDNRTGNRLYLCFIFFIRVKVICIRYEKNVKVILYTTNSVAVFFMDNKLPVRHPILRRRAG